MIDGSTSKTAARIDGSMSNGRLCMETVRRFVAAMPEETGVEDFCKGVTAAVHETCAACGADTARLLAEPAARATASAAVYSRRRREVWLVGDCHCIVGGRYHDNPKPDEEIIAARRSDFIRNELQKCRDEAELQRKTECLRADDAGRRHILPDLIAACSRQNRDYAVIDGFDIPMDKVRVIGVPPGETVIILASDGYPFIKETLAQSEEALARLIADDPLLIYRYRATKGVMNGYASFDDRSYIRFCD